MINSAQLADAQIHRASRLAGCVAVVTGASSGIGRAIAVALSRQGVQVCVVGRNPGTLAETVAAARQFSQVTSFHIDLTVPENLRPLLQYLEEEAGRLDILIHSAGVMHQDLMEHARLEDFDLQYATNVRAPYLVTAPAAVVDDRPWADRVYQLQRWVGGQAARGGAIRRHQARLEGNRRQRT